MTPQMYEIKVDGRLSEPAREAFCDMLIREVASGTVISGPVLDESHLHGILAELRVLGLRIASVHPVHVRMSVD